MTVRGVKVNPNIQLKVSTKTQLLGQQECHHSFFLCRVSFSSASQSGIRAVRMGFVRYTLLHLFYCLYSVKIDFLSAHYVSRIRHTKRSKTRSLSNQLCLHDKLVDNSNILRERICPEYYGSSEESF